MSCRTCKGIGWVEVSQDDLRPCIHCNGVAGPTAAEVIFLGLGFVFLFAMLLWSAQ